MAKLGFKSHVVDPSVYALNLSPKLFPFISINMKVLAYMSGILYIQTEVTGPIIWVCNNTGPEARV